MANTIYLAAAFLGLFGIAEWLFVTYKPQAEYTRKFVHIGTGLLSLLFPLLLTSVWSVLFLCSSFAVILILSLKYDMLKSINYIGRKSYGSIAYPVAVFGTFVFFLLRGDEQHHNLINFYLPILTLAICDPVAALIGKRWPYKRYKVGDGYKSLGGSAAFFISSALIAVILLQVFSSNLGVLEIILAAMIFASFGTLIEAFSSKGLDNVTVPASQIVGLIIVGYLF
jgi:phytol kinase